MAADHSHFECLQEEIDENFIDRLAADPNIVKNSIYLFVENIISYLWRTDQPLQLVLYHNCQTVTLFDREVGEALMHVIKVLENDIQRLFQGTKHKIWCKKSLQSFISRLEEELLSDVSVEVPRVLEFLAVSCRMADLMKRIGVENAKDMFVHEIVLALTKIQMRLRDAGGWSAVTDLLSNIFHKPELASEIVKFKPGDPANYI